MSESSSLVNECLLEELNLHGQNVADYFPIHKGIYEVTPGFRQWGQDLGNGPADGQLFQFDSHQSQYRRQKLCARQEALEKYYCLDRLSDQARYEVTAFVINRLLHEHPERFHLLQAGKTEARLACSDSGETLVFDKDLYLSSVETATSKSDSQPAYHDAIDALACQVQEDLAITELTPAGDNLSAIHLCFPNHWAASAKVGRPFLDIHEPVPGMGRINQQSSQIFNAIINKGPYVRFAWGISTDSRLNHHPVAPLGIADTVWRGRSFDRDHPKVFLRVERQSVWGFSASQAILFTIRTYFYDLAQIKQDTKRRNLLISAIDSMSEPALAYKGLGYKKELIAWLLN